MNEFRKCINWIDNVLGFDVCIALLLTKDKKEEL